jgi:hypothetical protein
MQLDHGIFWVKQIDRHDRNEVLRDTNIAQGAL